MPGDRGLVRAMTTDCCLNSSWQPVAMETMTLVWSLILVIRSQRPHLTSIPSLMSASTSPQVVYLRETEWEMERALI